MKKWKIFFVPQTHWDKEWYFTKNVSDVFLIDNINKIIEIAERDENEFKSYVYDGQYSIIDDYLEYYPERAKIIDKLIKKQKLIVGPWYTQTDTFNAIGESIVRNLLLGITLSQKRGHYLQTAYIPDSFGFNANLPQIFAKFNLKAMVYWRGIEQSQIKDSLFNNWIGLDQTVLPSFNLFKWGYGVGVSASLSTFMVNWTLAEMPQQAKIYLENVQDKLTAWKQRLSNTNNLLLFPFGSDQLPIYDYLQQWMDELNKIDQEHEWILATYDEYFDAVLAQKNLLLPTITGELRYGQFSRAHKTITSSRYDIKQLSKQLETLIYREVEPLAVIYQHLGGEYPFNIIQNSLKKLLSSQAHDSLGGCNTDLTNNTILTRLQMGIDTMESLITLMKKRIQTEVGLKPNDVLIFNLAPYARKQTKRMKIFTKKPSFIIKVRDKKLDFVVLNQEKINKQTFTKISCLNQAEMTEPVVGEEITYWTEILITIPKINGLSYQIITISEQEYCYQLRSTQENSIENNYYKITINLKTGILDIFDKKHQKNYYQAIALVATFNAGDTYDYSPSLKNEGQTNIFKKAIVNTFLLGKDCAKLVINYEYDVPIALDSDEYVVQNLTFEVLLNQTLIDLNLTMFNQAADIKWEIIFNTNCENVVSYADTAFGTIKRKPSDYQNVLKRWEQEKWHDYPIDIEAMENVCYVKNQNNFFSVYTMGNNEYQLKGDKHQYLSVTLFYGSSYIGRRYLKYRPGRASGVDDYPCSTPLANLQKELSFRLRLNMTDDINVVRNAKEWTEHLSYYQKQTINQFHWKGDTFVMTKNKLSHFPKEYVAPIANLVLEPGLVVSAVKKAEKNDAFVIRLYNSTEKEIIFPLPNNFYEVNLLEELLTDYHSDIIKPNEVKTYLIKE
ncbi:glycosyl hydrolase-related protein [Spiroplasma sp. SV19]|uniref:glycoside hydrolase family 38 N-terminal domain-containing protein n=1 Tax=Spiroplasma sp. SV19 TaxID=2570468 RepID=UPI0024B871FA|nr:glycosyl hydrolase-related protein [Spiroplasma sp. SV19]WHQ36561.1 hypothetical protein E7Y35_01265 [Spiroplasma sp. SV19]